MKILTLPLSIFACATLATATSLYVGTAGNATSWSLVAGTGAGTAIQAGSVISISADGTTGAPAIPGFNNSTWNGLWTGTLQFTLPLGATGVSLLVNNPLVDDRWILRLNGTDVADYARGASGLGVFNFGVGDSAFSFSGNSVFTINSGFSSGLNTLSLYVNNTGTGVLSDATRNLGPGDATYAGFDAVVSFNDVPEPSVWSLSAAGLALLGLYRRRQ